MLPLLRRVAFLLPTILLAANASPLHAADWPQFRGPHADGISPEPLEGSRFEVLWRRNVGIGCSGVTVAAGRAYTMGNTSDVTTIYCLDPATGGVFWSHSFPSPGEEKNGPPFLGGPAATPAISGGKVYAFDRFGDLFCLDAASGKVIWHLDLAKPFPGRTIPQWGYCASPVVDGDRLYIEPGGEGHTTACLDRHTGAVLWAAGSEGAAFSTPVLADLDGKRTLLAFTKSALVGRDARTGDPLWEVPWKSFRSVHVAAPVLIENRYVFISTRFGDGAKLFDLSGGSPREVWQNSKVKNYHSTSVHVDGCLYGFSTDRLVCVEANSGRVAWEQAGLGHGKVTAAANGRMLVQGEKGRLVLAAVSPRAFAPVCEIDVFNRVTYTAASISGGRIFCRSTAGEVACLRVVD